jgi:hypothetical protein
MNDRTQGPAGVLEPVTIDPSNLPEITLSPQRLDELCALALRLQVMHAKHAGIQLHPGEEVPYEKRPEASRRNMRTGATRLIQSLILLRYIEL